MRDIYLLFTGNYYSISGGYIYNRKLVENLRILGVDVKPVQLSEKHVFCSADLIENIELILSKIPAGSILLIDGLAFGSNHSLWEKYYHSHILITLIHLPLFLNSDFSSDCMNKNDELAALSFSAHIIVTSDYTKNILEKEGISRDKIAVIIPGVEFTSKKRHYPQVPKQLLCVSNISRSKNQLLLLNVLNRLKQFNWILHLVGSTQIDSEYSLDILNYISANKLGEQVIIHEEIIGDKLSEIYHQSDLFLFPSTFETYGMVVAEALSFRIPVFAYGSEGVRQSFRKYPVRFFNDENTLYELLLKVMKDRNFYYDICKNLFNSECLFPTWDKVAKSFNDVIKSV